jgi:hypothetical protein
MLTRGGFLLFSGALIQRQVRRPATTLFYSLKHENKRDKNVPPIDRRGFLTPQKEILILF